MTLMSDKTMPVVVAALAGSLVACCWDCGSARAASKAPWSS